MRFDTLFGVVFITSQLSLFMTLIIAVLTALSLREESAPVYIPSSVTYTYGDDTSNIVPGTCGVLETGTYNFLSGVYSAVYLGISVTTLVNNASTVELPDWSALAAYFASVKNTEQPNSFLGGAIGCPPCGIPCGSQPICNVSTHTDPVVCDSYASLPTGNSISRTPLGLSAYTLTFNEIEPATTPASAYIGFYYPNYAEPTIRFYVELNPDIGTDCLAAAAGYYYVSPNLQFHFIQYSTAPIGLLPTLLNDFPSFIGNAIQEALNVTKPATTCTVNQLVNSDYLGSNQYTIDQRTISFTWAVLAVGVIHLCFLLLKIIQEQLKPAETRSKDMVQIAKIDDE